MNEFELSGEYDDMLSRGLRLSGESKEYFINGRLRAMCKILPNDFHPKKILDFGCGIGTTSKFLSELYPQSQIIGTDTSKDAINYASRTFGNSRIEFQLQQDLSPNNKFDLCYVNGVFHHIPINERERYLSEINKMIVDGGFFSFFENNPLNPGTRIVMSRIPFDRDAITISHFRAKKLLLKSGFKEIIGTEFLFYFPRFLSFLRRTEKFLNKLPLGGQYLILAQK